MRQWKQYLSGPGLSVVLAALVLVLATLLGGSNRNHAVRLAIQELVALPILLIALRSLILSGEWKQHRVPLSILAGIALIPIVQIIPLPPSIWTQLPGREELVLALQLAGNPQGPMPISLTPEATLSAAFALIPPAAVFLTMLTIPQPRRASLAVVAIGCGLFSFVLAAAQLGTGEILYIDYRTTSGSVVGMFANRNHLATMSLMLLPISAALSMRPVAPGRPSGLSDKWVYGAFAVLVVVIVGATRSRTGIVLLGPAILGSYVMVWWALRQRNQAGRKFLAWTLGPAIGVAAILTVALPPIIDTFGTLPDDVSRTRQWPYVVEAANRYQPIGAGFDSFDPVFRSVEPLEHLDSTYFNRAHNDYLEVWLEGGVPAMALFFVLLAWFGRNWWLSWRSMRPQTSESLARAAGIAVMLLLSHSLVDFPVRTETIMVLLALCLALLVRDDEAAATLPKGSGTRTS